MAGPEPKIRELFSKAAECRTAEEQAAYLDQACQGNAELRAQLEELLQAHREAGSFLQEPSGVPAGTIDLPAAAERPGTVIGPYKLLEQIGEGGMGTVWMVQQTEPVKRVVALKLIKAGMDSKQVIARFEAERQALALTDHANIARVLDGGTTASGRPYFVMDLVKGVPITQYCDEHHLTPRQRLELFIPVCQAVQHAHQKGIVHRDLKPSNVLVALHDDKSVPKVIDFGVAKAIGYQLTEETLHTGFGAVVGTIEYMSPEQATLNQLDVDTRSDVYSLGVLLYELLAGSPPFSRKELVAAGLLETLRLIREQEPTKPSAKLSTAEGLPTLAANRGTEPAKLATLVRGELDWIVMKAMDKDRSRRYQTANGFAMDLQHYLADQPVVACPQSAGYRFRKFARRNRGTMLACLIILLSLVGGIIGTTWGMFRAQHARRHALLAQFAEAERADGERRAKEEVQKRLSQIEQGTDILASVFRDLDPIAAENAGVTSRALLGRRLSEAAQQLEGEALGDPLIVARLQHVLGISLHELGLLKQAEVVLDKAYRTRERLLGADHLDTVDTKHHLASLCRSQGKYALAETLYKEVLAVRTAKQGADYPDTLNSRQHLAMLYHSQGELDLAYTLYTEVLELRTAKLGADHPDTLTTQHRLALLYRSQGKYDLGETLCNEVLKLRTAKLGADHLDTLASKQLLAFFYRTQEKYAAAEPLYKEVLELRTAKLGPDHPDTLTSQHQLAQLYWSMNKFDLSTPLLEETVKLRKAKLEADHPVTLWTQMDLSSNYCGAGRFADAIALLEELHQECRRDLKRASLGVGRALLMAYALAGKTTEATTLVTEQVRTARNQFSVDSELAAELADTGEELLDAKAYVIAELLLRESVAIGEREVPDAWRTHHARSLLGGALLGQQKFDDAEPLLVQGYRGMLEREAPISKDADFSLTQTRERLVQLYDAWDRPDQAAKWRKELEKLKEKL